MTRNRSDRDGDSIRRRRLLRTVSAVGGVAVAGCVDETDSSDADGVETSDENGNDEDLEDDERESDGDNEDGPETEGETDENERDGPVRFLLDSSTGQGNIIEQYTPLAEYLEAETDAEIELHRVSNTEATRYAFESGQAELADASWVDPLLSDGLDIVGARRAYGSAYYFSTITTTPDSDVERLADLEGKTVALGPPSWVSSSLVPAQLLSEAGLDVGPYPDDDPVDLEIQSGYTHEEARDRLLYEDDVAAAGTGAFAVAPRVPRRQFDRYPDFVEHSGEYERAGDEIGDEPELQLLAVSEPLPRAPIAARSDWAGPVRGVIEDALLRAGPDDLRPEGHEPELWFTGVEDADRGDYRPYADLFDELEIEPEDVS